MQATVPAGEYLAWVAYWEVEPWGPWRDNVHAAIIAREVIRANPRLKRGAKMPDLSHFMLIDPATRQRAANERVVAVLQALATGGRRGH